MNDVLLHWGSLIVVAVGAVLTAGTAWPDDRRQSNRTDRNGGISSGSPRTRLRGPDSARVVEADSAAVEHSSVEVEVTASYGEDQCLRTAPDRRWS